MELVAEAGGVCRSHERRAGDQQGLHQFNAQVGEADQWCATGLGGIAVRQGRGGEAELVGEAGQGVMGGEIALQFAIDVLRQGRLARHVVEPVWCIVPRLGGRHQTEHGRQASLGFPEGRGPFAEQAGQRRLDAALRIVDQAHQRVAETAA